MCRAHLGCVPTVNPPDDRQHVKVEEEGEIAVALSQQEEQVAPGLSAQGEQERWEHQSTHVREEERDVENEHAPVCPDRGSPFTSQRKWSQVQERLGRCPGGHEHGEGGHPPGDPRVANGHRLIVSHGPDVAGDGHHQRQCLNGHQGSEKFAILAGWKRAVLADHSADAQGVGKSYEEDRQGHS